MKIYAIMRGDCEGSWPESKMYKTKEGARKALQTLVLHLNKENEEWDNKFEEKKPDQWSDGFDYIDLHEFELE